MDKKTEVAGFLKDLQEKIESGRLVAKHVRVLISNTDEVLGNGVLLQASPTPAAVTDTIYMCMSILCALRDHTLKTYAGHPEMLIGFRSFLDDIDRSLMRVEEESIH